MRKLLLASLLLPTLLFASNYEQGREIAGQAYHKAMQELSHQRTPEALMGRIYQGLPKEARLTLAESREEMNKLGKEALSSNPLNKILLEQAIIRAKQKNEQRPNKDITDASKLIEQSEVFINGGCYEEPANCKTDMSQKECLDELGYEPKNSIEQLIIEPELISSKSRSFIPYNGSERYFYNVRLDSCGAELSCQKQSLIKISEQCERLKVSITNIRTNTPIKITNVPTCKNPVVQFSGNFIDYYPQYKIHVEQMGLKEHWQSSFKNTTSYEACYPLGVSECLEGNFTKNINGILVTRPCWKKSHKYQCAYDKGSSCKAYLNQGCQQVQSRCISSSNGLCLRYQQAFNCQETKCTDKKKVCVKKVDCADGGCYVDATKNVTKEELGDGLVNLAALAGSSQDLANKNLSEAETASIFASQNFTCRKDGFGIGNCCVDRAREFARCKEEGEKKISQAKSKNLALYIGTYKDGWFGLKKRESWCVFNSRLAYLIRVSGGLNQLGIGFGSVHGDSNGADCRGLTPDELSRIKLSKIDLRELEEEAKKLFTSPNGNTIKNNNLNHIKRLSDGGVAYER